MRSIVTILFLLLIGFSINAQSTRKVNAKSKVKRLEYKQTVNDQGLRYLPELEISDLKFNDGDGNQILAANENAFLSLKLQNKGKGEAANLKLLVQNTASTLGLIIDEAQELGTLYPGQTNDIYLPFSSDDNLKTARSC